MKEQDLEIAKQKMDSACAAFWDVQSVLDLEKASPNKGFKPYPK